LATGCQGSPVWLATASPQEIAAAYGPRCQGYGFTPGTDAYAQCIQNEVLQQRQHNQQAEANMNAAYAAAAAKRKQQTATANCYRLGYQVICNTTTN
jgi:hypothetical protein